MFTAAPPSTCGGSVHPPARRLAWRAGGTTATIGGVRRAIGALLLTSLALAATACGGSSKGSASGGESAATLVPQSAVAFVALNTDLSSGQWKTVDGLLQKFPARDQLLASIRSQLTQQGVDWEKDVKPALGKELDVAVLSISGSSAGKTDAVAFLKPNDEGKLNALLEKGTGQKPVHEKIEGWTAIAQSQSTLDEIKNRKGKPLSDDSDFSDAMGKLPSEAVEKFYVAGTALQQALSQSRFGAAGSALPTGNFRFVTGAIEAKANGFKLSATTKGSGTGAGSTFRSQFLSKVPAGAYAFISF